MASTTIKTTNPAGIGDPGELLTPKQFAKTQKVSLSWLAKARKRGDGPPFVRFGRSVRYFPLRKTCFSSRANSSSFEAPNLTSSAAAFGSTSYRSLHCDREVRVFRDGSVTS